MLNFKKQFYISVNNINLECLRVILQVTKTGHKLPAGRLHHRITTIARISPENKKKSKKNKNKQG